MRTRGRTGVALALAALAAAGCATERTPREAGGDGDRVSRAEVERVLDAGRSRMVALADSVDAALLPVPFLRPSEEAALRRFLNADQLERARSLGVDRPRDEAALAALQGEGRLVALEDGTPHWVLADLDHSVPLVVPHARALLVEIGERFQAELAGLGLPALRLEVTSALRTAETQASLRRTNPNAAAGVSTHEYGTTVDLSYRSFAAPAGPLLGSLPGDLGWLEAHMERMAAAVVEGAAARRSGELQAILGRVLIEMQDEGKVMVTLERQQPVYHLTVARRM